jgi:hypothetical protein
MQAGVSVFANAGWLVLDASHSNRGVLDASHSSSYKDKRSFYFDDVARASASLFALPIKVSLPLSSF